MDYLSYTTKDYQLVQRYSLTSVLFYDREYRKVQASMNFRWGIDVQHLHNVFLQPRAGQRSKANSISSQKRGSSNQYPREISLLTYVEISIQTWAATLNSANSSTNALFQAAVKATLQQYMRTKKVDIEVNPLPGLHLPACEEELGDVCDRQFILNGITKNDFEIIDENSCVRPVSCQNPPSSRPNSPLYDKATSQVI